jgi:glutaredoxin 3
MKVEIYGAEWCGYCKNAVTLCESKGLEYDYIDIDDTVNRVNLEERLGMEARSIPQIFLDGKLVDGGFNGLKRELSRG